MVVKPFLFSASRTSPHTQRRLAWPAKAAGRQESDTDPEPRWMAVDSSFPRPTLPQPVVESMGSETRWSPGCASPVGEGRTVVNTQLRS